MSLPGESEDLPTPSHTTSYPRVPQGLPTSNHPAVGSPGTYVRPFLRASYTSSRRLG